MSVSVMKKLTAYIPLKDSELVTDRLTRLRCVEIAKTELDSEDIRFKRLDCDKKKSEYEGKLTEIRTVLPYLLKYTKRKKPLFSKPVILDKDEFVKSGRYDTAIKGVSDASKLIRRLDGMGARITKAETDIASLAPWVNYNGTLGNEETRFSKTVLGVLPFGCDEKLTKETLSELCCETEIVNRDESGVYAAFTFLKKDESEILSSLSKQGFIPSAFKDLDERDPVRAHARAVAAKKRLVDEKNDTVEELRRISELVDDIEISADICETYLNMTLARQKFVKFGECACISAWVAEEREERVSKALDKLDCAYEFSDVPEGEDAPILFKNNSFASNFEWVIGMYSYPKYGSFDPTFIMSIFYIVIFGLMFADVGYGLLMLLVGFLAPKVLYMKDSLKRALNMFGYCAIACMVFGAFFGSWFGDLPITVMRTFLHVPEDNILYKIFGGVVNTVEDPITFAVIALGAGAVHLIAGMGVKFYILCKEGKVLDAILDIASYWVLFAGIGVVFVSKNIGLVLVALGAGTILLTHGRKEKNIFKKLIGGFSGLYELISYASDLLSYSRILALCLASAVIANVINLVGSMMGATLPGIIVFVLVTILGHLLNIGINLLGTFVHTSRLQYLEFFGKFYEAGGEGFKPIEPTEKYSIDSTDTSDGR